MAYSTKASWLGCLLVSWGSERLVEVVEVLMGCLEMVHSSAALVAFGSIFIVSVSVLGSLLVAEVAEMDLELYLVRFCLIRDIFNEPS